MLSCFWGICQVAPMSRLRFFIGKYNLLKLRIDLKAVVYIPICCLNPHFFFLFLFMVELCCCIFSARDVFLGHGSFSWITQSSILMWMMKEQYLILTKKFNIQRFGTQWCLLQRTWMTRHSPRFHHWKPTENTSMQIQIWQKMRMHHTSLTKLEMPTYHSIWNTYKQ